MVNSPRTTSIHILDDDSLLHVFYLYQPFLLGEDQDAGARLFGGGQGWARGRWWYRLTHVCQRWRNVIFGSASYLDLALVCTYGTPVADMLAHSPPLPLVVDYTEKGRNITTDDEEGIILALKQHERVLRVRLKVTSQRKFLAAMDEEYPILEYLIIGPPDEDNNTTLIFPETFRAPHLPHFRPRGFALPIGSRLLTTSVGLVTLSLVMLHPSTYFHPNNLLQWVALMPQLETLSIYFEFSIPNRDVKRQLTHAPVIAPVTLPNLHHFLFRGVSTYLDALVHRITAPRLAKLDIDFFSQLTFSVPRLPEFINSTENLRSESATFKFFGEYVSVAVYPRELRVYSLGILVDGWHLDWQVSSMAKISDLFSQVFSAVGHLTLDHEEHSQSSEEHNKVERTEWRNFLRPFSKVKTLRIYDGLVEELSRCLELEDGELPLELLPELQELRYSGSGDTGDPFTSFINARQNTGRPVTLVSD